MTTLFTPSCQHEGKRTRPAFFFCSFLSAATETKSPVCVCLCECACVWPCPSPYSNLRTKKIKSSHEASKTASPKKEKKKCPCVFLFSPSGVPIHRDLRWQVKHEGRSSLRRWRSEGGGGLVGAEGFLSLCQSRLKNVRHTLKGGGGSETLHQAGKIHAIQQAPLCFAGHQSKLEGWRGQWGTGGGFRRKGRN